MNHGLINFGPVTLLTPHQWRIYKYPTECLELKNLLINFSSALVQGNDISWIYHKRENAKKGTGVAGSLKDRKARLVWIPFLELGFGLWKERWTHNLALPILPILELLNYFYCSLKNFACVYKCDILEERMFDIYF